MSALNTDEMSRLSWEHYRCFASLANTKNFGLAASQADVSLSTLRRRIDTLETTFGAQLFTGMGPSFALTAKGFALHAQVLEMDNLASELETLLAQGTLNEIKIGAWHSLVPQVVQNFALNFQNEHDDIRVIVEALPIGSDDSTRSIDVMVNSCVPNWAGSNSDSVGTSQLQAYCRASMAQAIPPAKRGDLSQYVFIHTRDSMNQPTAARLQKPFLLNCKKVITVGSADELAALVKAGVGVGFLMDWEVPTKVVPLEAGETAHFPLYLSYRRSLLESVTNVHFLAGLRGYLRKKFNWDARLSASDTHMAADGRVGFTTYKKVVPLGFKQDGPVDRLRDKVVALGRS